MKTRIAILTLFFALGLAALGGVIAADKQTASANKAEVAKEFSDYQKPSDDELRKRLTPLQYKVTQEEGTERPFRNEYWDNKQEGHP